MVKRVPASMHSRQQLSDLIEGRLSSSEGRADLIKLATRLIVEEALEGEATDAVGREYYEHGGGSGAYRNGNRTGRLRTAEGMVEYSAPQVTGGAEPFRSEIRDHLKGRTAALEDLVYGDTALFSAMWDWGAAVTRCKWFRLVAFRV